ncbi:MAG: glycyl-radical enzyme activating protein [Ruminococcaceae bacterium]|nr:glycyl-radical enzyme activating protein [Oscillospiraceae bacterium]
MEYKANITNISRGSFHDGPGIRTVVYFGGCLLSCKWCHNPETLSFKSDVVYIKSKCIHCGRCVEICPQGHEIRGNDMYFNRVSCKKCGKCAELCPSGALTVTSKPYTPEKLFKEIKKDKFYFNQSCGGVTFSGGECLLQSDFLKEVLKYCREEKINTCIESAFFVPFENILKVINDIDFVFADLKIPDREKHKEYTGQYNDRIIENIRKTSEIHSNIIIRIPLIPGVNDSERDMADFARIINTFGCGVKGVELLKYNYLAESKYENLGKEYTKFSENTQSDGHLNSLVKALKESLIRDIAVFYK